ncbi:DUF1289 domain-containing protein [Shewanella maritima]|uniref:DUF1289 domain-containing protein n=1 Tax=Shewanella maritima TaxID=2520507 RepID=A0A411PLF2_9GAMM|nr:DUF1289 domain-containing protein [Shewanella maritima]QBF84345.1 DUF1289 domain-containing protein [Shewanella maritima]
MDLKSHVQSPCIRHCCLDENDVCLGCQRTYKEILDWHSMTIAQQLALKAELKNRQCAAQAKRSFSDK